MNSYSIFFLTNSFFGITKRLPYYIHIHCDFNISLPLPPQETDVLNAAKRTLEAEILALKDKKKELEDMLKTHNCMLVVNSSDEEENKLK